MPFPYETSKELVRTRRSKDKDSRSTTSSSSSKRSKHTSGSSSRSNPQSDRGPQLALYTQQNLTLDQLPALPESGTASPGSASSPILRATSVTSQPQHPPPSSSQLHTPAALQQYLDTDDVETPRSEFAPQPQAEPDQSLRQSGNLRERDTEDNKLLDSHTATPLAATTQQYQPPSRDHSVSPGFFGQPFELNRSYSSRTSSSRRNESPYYSASSPPPQSVSPSVRPYTGPGSPDPNQYQPPPHSQVAYLASPPAFTPAIPYNSGGASTESYYPPPYVGPQYLQMTHPGGHADLQPGPSQTIPSYPNYPPPLHPQAYLNHLQHQAARAPGSPSFRMSVPGEFPVPPQLQATPPAERPSSEKPVNEDDAAGLLQRIQGAIPDLETLLHRYKETSGELGKRESKLQETEAQKSEQVRQREAEISRLEKQLDGVKLKYGAEVDKLRLEVGNKDEQRKELQESLASEQQSRKELEASHRALETEHQELRKIREAEKNTMDKLAASQKAQEEIIKAGTTFETQLYNEKKLHLQAVESLEASHARQMKELEASHLRARQEAERSLKLKQASLDESRRNHEEDKDTWEQERREWDWQRSIIPEEQRNLLAAQYETEMAKMKGKHETAIALMRKEAEDEKAKLLGNIARLKAGWDDYKERCLRSQQKLQATINAITAEKARLQEVADAFGEVTDLKSKEDPYYLDAFSNLERQIIDLATEHFQDVPGPVPDKIRRTIPRTLPSFSGDTEPARNIRAAYVQHHISSIIARRVFRPFLFVLTGHLEPADRLFRDISEELKRKSTRREATWRQRTLHAAYTASSAKRSINRVASSIVEEIVDAIKCFAHPTRWERISVAVRRVVKTAAESWRYATIEMGLITASMSGEEIVRAPAAGPGVSLSNDATSSRKVLLSLFPFIRRDPVIGDLRSEQSLDDQGYTYTRGRVLLSDDADVVACQKGIPRYGSMSRRSQVTPSASRTQSRAQEQQFEGEGNAQSSTSQPDTPSLEHRLTPSPTSRSDSPSPYDRGTPSPTSRHDTPSPDRPSSPIQQDSPSPDDRATPSPKSRQETTPPGIRATPSPTAPHATHFPDHRGAPSPMGPEEFSSPQHQAIPVPTGPGDDDRAIPAPLGEGLDNWQDAERDSRTPTPSMTRPDQVPVASDGSATSSRQSIRSRATASSQGSGQSRNEAAGAPEWGDAGGRISASKTVGDEW